VSFDTLSISEATVHSSVEASAELLDLEGLKAAIANQGKLIPLLRDAINRSSAILDERYKQNLSITDIVRGVPG